MGIPHDVRILKSTINSSSSYYRVVNPPYALQFGYRGKRHTFLPLGELWLGMFLHTNPPRGTISLALGTRSSPLPLLGH